MKDYEHSKQDVYETKKEELKPITEKLEKEIDEISKLREEYNKKKTVPYYEQIQQLALSGPSGEQLSKIVSDMNKGFTSRELAILQKHNLPLPSNVLIETLKGGDKVGEVLDKSGDINKKLGIAKGQLSTTKKAQKENSFI